MHKIHPLAFSESSQDVELQEWLLEVAKLGEDSSFQSLAYCATTAVGSN